MAVYKKTYRPYEGTTTPSWSRFLVIPRFAFEEMHQSRRLVLFFILSYILPLIWGLVIYLHHNLSALKLLKIPVSNLLAINSIFFLTLLGLQSINAFFLTAFVGPGLISPDLANNALPLYLARPFSRSEYVLGKISVLWILLSLMTWVPGLLLFGLQSYFEGLAWAGENLRIAVGFFFGAWVWILVLSLLALALSAWVKWKPAAGALLCGVFFVAGGFGAAIDNMLRTKWGQLINVSHLVGVVWMSLFDPPSQRGQGAVFFRVPRGQEIPLEAACLALLVICCLCLFLLSKKIRGAEVVR